MQRSQFEMVTLRCLAYLSFLTGVLSKSKGGLDDSEVQGLVYILEVIREHLEQIKIIAFSKEVLS